MLAIALLNLCILEEFAIALQYNDKYSELCVKLFPFNRINEIFYKNEAKHWGKILVI